MCTHVVAAVTYWLDEDELVAGAGAAAAVDVTAAAAIDDATADVGVRVVAPTGVVWSLTQPPAADAAQLPAAALISAARARPTPTQGKPTFDAAAGIPNDVHASIQYQTTLSNVGLPAAAVTAKALPDITTPTKALPAISATAITKTTAAFSIHNNGDWDVAPLGPMSLRPPFLDSLVTHYYFGSLTHQPYIYLRIK
jgi:hypothetical protein